MRMIDTHAHLFEDDYQEDLEEVVLRATEVGVERVLLPNIDENSIESVKSAVSKFPHIFKAMMGLHPTSVTDNWEIQLSKIKHELDSNNKYIAIGEIGLDLHWDKSTLHIQKMAFEEQLKWSVDKNLPVSIHSREAIDQVIESIKNVDYKNIFGVFHSFGGNEDDLNNILSLDNFYIGINGVVTFKNSGLDKVIKNCPLDKVVIETDSPWLTPVPNRGKRNESSYLTEIIKALSLIYEITESEVAERTTYNACKVFKI